ncbi:N-acetylmuramoyl-L-alanine amidase [Gordonia sp. (in: high G+C Gram-positive bacteria)]|uniref:N-acetylmuramoyl-L-alanine amidase n=1 Tax=Gordonia sp. (in: high G+C Gram-positive bacteria) TaxID=84139 RepID=UPI00169AB6FF|nr:N-acetylmuramoyl-L-alanine amidase [Gordonia sp. (in: high G+C Gram-positive bacteria)]NLG48246.1 N-acetylmuramoyl-L-alanine amidase [Gordonia sp. (in: high G+C Gram-positive bacteria)]
MAAVRVRRRVMVAASLLASSALIGGVLVASPTDAAPTAGALTGKTVFLDPGHQGSAAGQNLSKQVNDGRGGTKDCQTTGTTAVGGKTEHTINWEVAQLVKAALESKGARVLMSRKDDTGWGGCVDERAEAASRSGADLAVSLHADSTSQGADPGKSGFHMIVPTLPIPDKAVDAVQAGEGRKASNTVRDALKKAGIAPANYGGAIDGVVTRPDIAGSNLTRVPLAFIEMGNLSDPADAAVLSTPQGATKYAVAITDGITDYLGGRASAANPTAPAPDPNAKPTDPAAPPAESTSPDLSGLSGVEAIGPLIDQLAKAKSPQEAQKILMTQGQDVSADVLKAILAVVYAVFGGKLPI